MPSLSRSTVINAPIKNVFAFICEPSNLVRYLPSHVEAHHVNLPLSEGSSFRWQLELFGMRQRGVWTIETLEPLTRYVASTTGAIASRWSFLLEPHDLRTRLTIKISYFVPVSKLKRAAHDLLEPQIAELFHTFLVSLQHAIERN